MLLQATVYVYEDNQEIQGFIGLNEEYIEGIFVSDEKQSQTISFYQREGFVVQHSSLDKVSRPRRFGMSMAANMLAAYYDRSENTEELFQNLAISKDSSYKENLNQYDVIKINMQEFLSMSGTMEKMLGMLKNYLVSDFEETYPEVCFRDEKNLIQVMKDVFSYTKCPFVILIDEWDCLFREYKQDKEAQRKYLDFLRAWLKDKDYVAMAYMTGILPIKKYGSNACW